MSDKTIEVFVNGQVFELNHATTLEHAIGLWQRHRLIGDKFAVAINNEFVPRSSYADTWLASGDMVDVVQAVGGG